MSVVPEQKIPTGNREDEIQVYDLHKSFGALEVLTGIDLVVRRGEVVCVIGPSGSGKSTLLRCINLLEQPTRGRIFILNDEITDPDADRVRDPYADARPDVPPRGGEQEHRLRPVRIRQLLSGRRG